MKIKRIQVKNIGPYVNENAFDFDVSDITKRMVLIGGKNGAGKTTLFNAIKICLYGCVAYGFESNNAKYFAEIEKIINANEKLQKIGEAEVVIDLLMDDGKYDHTYTFVRSWRVAGKKIAETFTVYKDGETLSETEKSDFESYLLQTLPPNLFRFYFFDGEKISDFVFNSSKNSDFKDAFLKLCSLDTMEIIRENFRRISRSKAKGTMTLSAEYDRCLEADNLIAQRVECAEDEYREISNEILIIDQRLASLEKAYAKGGGISKKEWRSMQDQIAKEDVRREGRHKWLKELANSVLPFIILRTQLEELKAQIALEHKAQANRLDTRFKTNEEKLIKAGGEKARELQERIEELIRLISITRDELERIESKDENDASLTEENNLHKADQKFKYYEQEIAKATRTNTALRKKELVDSLVNEIKLQATTALKQEIVRKTNEKLRRVIVDDYVEIESIDRYIKLKGRDGASEGQTLSIAYCFLGTLFEDSELEFPFIIDSPTGKMDFEKRQAVADIIPLVFNQMIAFVQSAEVERFADRFYANPDSQYLTVVASPQDQAVVVYEGIDFFDSYQREHKGDEK